MASLAVQGVSTGVAIPVSIVQVTTLTLTASTTVSVVDTFVCLAKISLVAYTGATWLSPPASISPTASVTAQLKPLQVKAFLHPARTFCAPYLFFSAAHRKPACNAPTDPNPVVVHRSIHISSLELLPHAIYS